MPVPGLLVLTALLLTVPAAPASDTAATIEKDVKRCLDKAVTTQDIVECYGRGYSRMDARMNTVYQALITGLKKPERDLLVEAQRKWLAFREAESAAAAALDPSRDGSLGRVNRNALGYEFLKVRTLELEHYLQDAKESGE